jgi:hypothetical protein
MQVQLYRADGFLQQHHHDTGKRQFAMAGEVSVAGAMTTAERFIVNKFTRRLNSGFRGTI